MTELVFTNGVGTTTLRCARTIRDVEAKLDYFQIWKFFVCFNPADITKCPLPANMMGITHCFIFTGVVS